MLDLPEEAFNESIILSTSYAGHLDLHRFHAFHIADVFIRGERTAPVNVEKLYRNLKVVKSLSNIVRSLQKQLLP